MFQSQALPHDLRQPLAFVPPKGVIDSVRFGLVNDETIARLAVMELDANAPTRRCTTIVGKNIHCPHFFDN
jgi:hypothetical protein